MKMEETQLLSKEERQDFNALFPHLIQELVDSPELRDMPDTNLWLAKVLEYNVPHGKQSRGLSTVLACKYFVKDLSQESMQSCYVLGWCVEMLQAHFLVSDDIMDGSETRRGALCWYRVDDLGTAAFNDAILLEAAIYLLLKKYFGEKEYYASLMEVFHDATFKTTYGQSLDTRTGIAQRFETYTLELYSAIVKYKASYYTFYLPVVLGMTVAGIKDPECLRQVEAVSLEMGHFFQVQDDYLDCFGDVGVTGKIGTDIQDGKCSWLVVNALQNANTAQRRILLENYGKNDPEKVEAVKEMFRVMGIEKLYLDFEHESYNKIKTFIEEMSPDLPKKLFHDMLNKIYKRSS